MGKLRLLRTVLVAVALAISYAAAVTFGLVVLVHKVVGLRNDTESEMAGLDHSFHGERGYGMLNAG